MKIILLLFVFGIIISLSQQATERKRYSIPAKRSMGSDVQISEQRIYQDKDAHLHPFGRLTKHGYAHRMDGTRQGILAFTI